MKVGIETINCQLIEKELKKRGETEIEYLGKYWNPDNPYSVDLSVEVFRFRSGDLVIKTNGGPIWESEQEFEEILNEYRIILE